MIQLEPILPLSTAHAPGASALQDAIDRHAAMSREEGALFYAGDGESIAEMPEWLSTLLAFARSKGAVWLLLDRDAETTDELPEWDW